MGGIKAYVLWTEEVMDEVFYSLSEADKTRLSFYGEELDQLLFEWYQEGLSVEEGISTVHRYLKGMPVPVAIDGM